jgi:hypothetical protein
MAGDDNGFYTAVVSAGFFAAKKLLDGIAHWLLQT